MLNHEDRATAEGYRGSVTAAPPPPLQKNPAPHTPSSLPRYDAKVGKHKYEWLAYFDTAREKDAYILKKRKQFKLAVKGALDKIRGAGMGDDVADADVDAAVAAAAAASSSKSSKLPRKKNAKRKAKTAAAHEAAAAAPRAAAAAAAAASASAAAAEGHDAAAAAAPADDVAFECVSSAAFSADAPLRKRRRTDSLASLAAATTATTAAATAADVRPIMVSLLSPAGRPAHEGQATPASCAPRAAVAPPSSVKKPAAAAAAAATPETNDEIALILAGLGGAVSPPLP